MSGCLLFIFIAHSDAYTVAETISRLSHRQTSFLVHVNRDWQIEPFERLVSDKVGMVNERESVKWGTVSLLNAILTAVRQALRDTACKRIILLSQNCVPLMPVQEIVDFFGKSVETEFIGMRRMNSFGSDHWRLSHSMKSSKIPLWFSHSFLGRIQRKTGFALPSLDWRLGLDGRTPYKGSLWWALTRAACEFICEEYEDNESLQSYSSELFGPEEIIPHTLLASSRFRTNIAHHLTYERWRLGRPSPDWLSVSDLSALCHLGTRWIDAYGEGHAMFARKFQVGSG